MGVGAAYWRTRFRFWGRNHPEQPGYSLLVPVPGDLPVFLETALAVLRLQQSEHRVETIVIPDQVTPRIRQLVAEAAPGWAGPLRMLPLPLPERRLLPRLGNPSRNHGVQVIAGIDRARGSHVVLHDADLFLLDPTVLDDQYRQVRDRDLDAGGVSPVWDPWFAEHGLSLVATWEMIARRKWLRSFPPHLHMGHTGELFGESHVFDTTLFAQSQTAPERLAVLEGTEDRFAHFNYVISTYRHFLRAPRPFLDDHFRLVLVRVFLDLFERSETARDVPPVATLADGLTRPDAAVVFPRSDEQTNTRWRAFRDTLGRILGGAWTDDTARRDAVAALAPFDRHYDYRG